MYDIVIIGAGISGAAIAREVSKYSLKTLVVEKESDVSNGTTKANSAIVHAGYDAPPGTLMAKYNAKGNKMFTKVCNELDVPFKRVGSLVLAFNEKEKRHLEELYKRGVENKIPDMKIISGEEARELEPNINRDVIGALHAKTAGIVGPWELCIALMESAVTNKVELQLKTEVVDIEKIEEGYRLHTSSGIIETKVIINASGVYADKIHNMVSTPTFKITPRRGQYFVLDKTQGSIINKVLFQCPSELGKGVLMTPTVHGNLLIGPDSEEIEDKENLSTTSHRLQYVKETAAKSIKNIDYRDSIRNFAGLRATSDTRDFIIGESENAPNFYNVAGIKSPGLSSALAFAQDIVEMVVSKFSNVELNREFNRYREQLVFNELSQKEKNRLIKEDPKYGKIVCRCETVTEGDVIDSIRRPVGAKTLDGIKKRCRPGMGRCQGGFCGPRIQEILAKELGVDLEDITLDKEGSYILTEKTKN